jgi:hypothetical protein
MVEVAAAQLFARCEAGDESAADPQVVDGTLDIALGDEPLAITAEEANALDDAARAALEQGDLSIAWARAQVARWSARLLGVPVVEAYAWLTLALIAVQQEAYAQARTAVGQARRLFRAGQRDDDVAQCDRLLAHVDAQERLAALSPEERQQLDQARDAWEALSDEERDRLEQVQRIVARVQTVFTRRAAGELDQATSAMVDGALSEQLGAVVLSADDARGVLGAAQQALENHDRQLAWILAHTGRWIAVQAGDGQLAASATLLVAEASERLGWLVEVVDARTEVIRWLRPMANYRGTPEHSNALASQLSNRGNARRAYGDPHGAIVDYTEAIRWFGLLADDPGTPQHRGEFARVLSNRGNARQARVT